MFRDFLRFAEELFAILHFVRGIVVLLFLILAALTLLLTAVEDLSVTEGIYFAAITGLTVGFGDIAPVTPLGRLAAIAIGLLGIVFTGIVVAVVNRALANAVADKRRREKASGE